MTTRFTDDILHNMDSSDFVVRKWKWTSVQIFALFGIVFVAIYLAATITFDIGEKMFFFISLTFLFATLGWFTITLASRNRDLVMATEFQNALLASAAQLSTRFCFIAKGDGSIVYIDPGFQRLFQPFMHKGAGTVEDLFTYAEAGEALKQKVMDILKQNKNDRLQLVLKDMAGKPLPLMITVDVLPRPKGFFLFRGRDYVEKRQAGDSGQNPAASASDITSARLLSHALFVLPEGILVTDKDGVITYVNHALEEWLGFGTGEMLVSPMKLEELCHRYTGSEIGRPVWDSFEGEATFKRKDKTLVTLKTRQTLIRDGGVVLGLSAILSPVETTKK